MLSFDNLDLRAKDCSKLQDGKENSWKKTAHKNLGTNVHKRLKCKSFVLSGKGEVFGKSVASR